MWLGLDGDAQVTPNSNEAQILDALAELQPDPQNPQFLEALNLSKWGRDRPIIVLDSTYRRNRDLGFVGMYPPLPVQPVLRIVDNLNNPSDGAPMNDINWWLGDGKKQVESIQRDGHIPILNADPFIDHKVKFSEVVG
jgi:hypothetical protein